MMDIAEAVRKAGESVAERRTSESFAYFRRRERCVCVVAYWLWEELVLHAPTSRV